RAGLDLHAGRAAAIGRLPRLARELPHPVGEVGGEQFLLALLQRPPFVGVEVAGESDLGADELGPAGVAVVLEPVRHHQPRPVVFRGLADGVQERLDLLAHHGFSTTTGCVHAVSTSPFLKGFGCGLSETTRARTYSSLPVTLYTGDRSVEVAAILP